MSKLENLLASSVVISKDAPVREKSFRIIKLRELNVNPNYQREVKEAAIRKIMSKFDKNAVGVPVVGQQDDGSYWVVDGLQRVTSLIRLGYKEWRFEVIRSKGEEHEAALFNIINSGRTRLTAGELFAARLTAQDEIAWKVKELVDEMGFTVVTVPHIGAKKGGRTKPGDLACVKMLYDTVHIYGKEPLKFALGIIKELWWEDMNSTHDCIVAGLAKFHVLKDGNVDRERFIRQLSTIAPLRIKMLASQGVRGMPDNVVDVLEKISKKIVRRKK